MGVSVKKFLNNTGTGGEAVVSQTEYKDDSAENRITIKDGYEFHWGPNEVRNFMDDGVGAAHAGFQAADGTEDNVIENNQSFGSSRS